MNNKLYEKPRTSVVENEDLLSVGKKQNDGSYKVMTIKKVDFFTDVNIEGYLLVTELINANNGIYITGSIGGGGDHVRSDAQIEVNNLLGGYALMSFYNSEPDSESALTFAGKLSNDSIVQTAAIFQKFVDYVNTVGAYNSMIGIHVPGVGHDNIPFMLYDNDSVWLCAGPTSAEKWREVPPDQWVINTGHGYTVGTLNPIDGFLFDGRNGGIRCADLTNKGVDMAYSGSAGYGTIECIDWAVPETPVRLPFVVNNGIKIYANGRTNLMNVPTSASGLATGDIWNDSGTLKIV